MTLRRRDVLQTAAALAATSGGAGAASSHEGKMFGLIGKMRATPGKRDELVALLLRGSGAMPGCLSYVVARDPEDADGIWITEVWDSEESHKASLSLAAVQTTIAGARALIAGFSERRETEPVGGVGLFVS